MNTVLVTGAAGFVGSHVCKRLHDDGWRVIAIDNMQKTYDPKVKVMRLLDLSSHCQSHPERFVFEQVSILRQTRVEELIAIYAVETVVHLAAVAGVRDSLENPRLFIDTNVHGFQSILSSIRKLEVKMIYASSSSVYGGVAGGQQDESLQCSQPKSLYAATKLMNESQAYAHHVAYGGSFVGLRFFSVYGPWGRPDMVLWKWAEAIRVGKPITVYNNGGMTRDWTYIDDVVEAIAMCLNPEQPDLVPQVYNVGGGEPILLNDAIMLIEDFYKTIAYREYEPMQRCDVIASDADWGRLHEATEWMPRVQFRTGLVKFLTWLEKHFQKEEESCS